MRAAPSPVHHWRHPPATRATQAPNQPIRSPFNTSHLERQREHAEELGARLLYDRSEDEGEPLYVMADPAGHPFCLLVQ